ncbi:MAG: carbohydrate kinase [Saprospiraceae bacterium]|nr:carbohydrate kinase [Saprospiraceae bacterium]
MPAPLPTLFRRPPFRVMIIGDVMIDRYLKGGVSRISPEAPVPVVHLKERSEHLGGAANVALNILALEAEPLLVSVVGTDAEGDRLETLMRENGLRHDGILREEGRRTTVKTRVMAGGQHLLRVDAEDTHALSASARGRMLDMVHAFIRAERPDVLVFQDYNKGVLDEDLIRKVMEMAKESGIPVTVDPKFRHFLDYRGVSLFKPNLKELIEGLGMDIPAEQEALCRACRQLHGHLDQGITLVTLSDKGAFWMDHRVDQYGLVPVFPRDIVDVCGAGDSVIAVASLALAAGWPAGEIALLANLAGGQVCERPGVVPVNRDRLVSELERVVSAG